MTIEVIVPKSLKVKTNLQDMHPNADMTLPSATEQADLVSTQQASLKTLDDEIKIYVKRLNESDGEVSKSVHAELVKLVAQRLVLTEKAKYKEVAALLMFGTIDVTRAGYIRQPDGSLVADVGKRGVYAQRATRHMDLSRWQSKLWSKAEIAHSERTDPTRSEPANPVPFGFPKEVYVGTVAYTEPLQALRDGVAFSSVHMAWKNALTPKWSDVEPEVTAAGAFNAARKQASKFKVTLKVKKSGETFYRKTRANVSQYPSSVAGAVVGILETASRATLVLTSGQLMAVKAALLLMTPEPETVPVPAGASPA